MTATRPTLAAVAARAGVAPSTASLAFAGSPRVAEPTRARVLAAAAVLGYPGPDPMARSLRRRRSRPGRRDRRRAAAVRVPRPGGGQPAGRDVRGARAAGGGLLLLPGDAERSGPPADLLGAVPLDAAVFATCGLDDDPVLAVAAPGGCRSSASTGRGPTTSRSSASTTLPAPSSWPGTCCGLGHRRLAVLTLPLRLDGSRGSSPRSSRTVPYRDAVTADRRRGALPECPDVGDRGECGRGG